MNNLSLRIISALVLAPAVIVLVLNISVVVFHWIIVLVVLLAFLELGRMMQLPLLVTGLGCLLMLVLMQLLARQESLLILLNSVVALFWLVQIFTLRYFKLEKKLHWMYFPLVGLLLLGFYGGSLFLYQLPYNGRMVFLALLLLVWSADSCAYFGGKIWGRHKLAASISPGKTVEGLIAGLIASVVVAFCFLYFFVAELNSWTVIVITALTALFSVVGDLYESCLKRATGVKDSGHILPGHGGVLDRIDGLVAATPVFATLWVLLL